eukprot:CAMPEP_0174916292 /NCGR_PEP_ID=MMETSP1355-20121228/1722_1 /TAXON_ID=464990 /ORGANISM="Hemiselmis tepida, Strain CCMP443" /LENGTH=315 /DNA_ID=CAMNT_0016161283 /DNA_START=33 /DNA_END=980 /DNA_ORIENTATION=+
MAGADADMPQRQETLGLASAYQKEGDTLQSATASIMHIKVEKRFDPELGIVIGERTELRGMGKRVHPSPPKAPPAEPARPAMYGIGLKVADYPPHAILEVNDLRDEQGRSIKSATRKGDILEAINDVSVHDLSIEQLELFVFGPKDTTVSLLMVSKDTQRPYHVHALRHIPISFALGISLTLRRPFQVQRVDELLDAQNNNVNHLVEPGDIVEAFNGMSVAELAIRPVQDIIFGPIDSIVNLTLRSVRTNGTYELAVKRHLPAVSWQRWEEYGGMTQDAGSSVVSSGIENAAENEGAEGGNVVGFGNDDVTGEFI